jgi:mono/diheme cytochrome c family protein
LRQKASILITFALLAVLAGCGEDLSKKTDAELGLNEQQARGRRAYQVHCAACHAAYTSSSSKGPTMKGLYRKQYLPSGLVANDRFVEESFVRGRRMMPALGGAMSQQDVADVIAYLHTL